MFVNFRIIIMNVMSIIQIFYLGEELMIRFLTCTSKLDFNYAVRKIKEFTSVPSNSLFKSYFNTIKTWKQLICSCFNSTFPVGSNAILHNILNTVADFMKHLPSGCHTFNDTSDINNTNRERENFNNKESLIHKTPASKVSIKFASKISKSRLNSGDKIPIEDIKNKVKTFKNLANKIRGITKRKLLQGTTASCKSLKVIDGFIDNYERLNEAADELLPKQNNNQSQGSRKKGTKRKLTETDMEYRMICLLFRRMLP